MADIRETLELVCLLLNIFYSMLGIIGLLHKKTDIKQPEKETNPLRACPACSESIPKKEK